MNDNYLWDRSGEPDSQVQKLEEILGTLRYQPRPLAIPSNVRVRRRRTFFPALAIAAVIALLAVASGVWFHFRQRQSPQSLTAAREPQPRATQPALVSPNNQAAEVTGIDKQSSQRPNRHRERSQNLLAGPRSRRATPNVPELTARELAEKEQVLLALRLVSAKLHVAQRKTQGAPSLNTIRNQHKIG